MSKKVRKRIYLSGRVQGVGCRAYINQNANLLEISGWVKNLADGRVEAVFAGDRDKVKEMLKIAKQGPTFGKVTDIEISDEEYKGEFNKFRIKY
ncbi:acylphosphatase [Halobacteroides halobius DSM 5150]|uniref:acylphosphatase n=1 Tax=Halobacteroides halobius (strain ATCC 35273 / DSM 5150 / MD-1) TaxID=748449 RepID=L0K7S2_HALHC|nr:acylphosphatase [Halobacteroides halobius]AGB41076.1 acylphosphatase [Halobacteroides halobius DSM 5150]